MWDDGYPSGGNYWSDQPALDSRCGPFQNETGSDGFCDYAYNIDFDNVDRYPLAAPYVPMLSDLNMDGKVDIQDITIVAIAFGSKLGDPNWYSLADLDNSGLIDIVDITMVAVDFGKTV